LLSILMEEVGGALPDAKSKGSWEKGGGKN